MKAWAWLTAKPGRWLVVLFVVAFLTFLALPARAEQRLEVEAGSAVVRGAAPVLGLTWSCPGCGPVGTGYELGFDLIGQKATGAERNNIQVRGALVDAVGPVELGLGLFTQNNPDPYVCAWGFHLLARYRFTDRLAIAWRHSSSADSCQPNTGRDLLAVAWRF